YAGASPRSKGLRRACIPATVTGEQRDNSRQYTRQSHTRKDAIFRALGAAETALSELCLRLLSHRQPGWASLLSTFPLGRSASEFQVALLCRLCPGRSERADRFVKSIRRRCGLRRSAGEVSPRRGRELRTSAERRCRCDSISCRWCEF